ncbi:MAG: hypothetical protein IJL08_04725 [Oscillospiraceae bacterium]|nr:hypothetical protein [Oscillospiraceae bacterium]
MKKQHLTAFFLEALLLVVIFVAVILVLTGVFGAARAQSAAARRLTTAVTLAANAAEAVSASDSLEQAAALLDEGGNVTLTGGRCEAAYDAEGRPCSDGGALRVEIRWEAAPENAALVSSRIRVLGAEGQELYALETARFVKEAAA